MGIGQRWWFSSGVRLLSVLSVLMMVVDHSFIRSCHSFISCSYSLKYCSFVISSSSLISFSGYRSIATKPNKASTVTNSKYHEII